MLNDPALLLLDEPTASLGPAAARELPARRGKRDREELFVTVAVRGRPRSPL